MNMAPADNLSIGSYLYICLCFTLYATLNRSTSPPFQLTYEFCASVTDSKLICLAEPECIWLALQVRCLKSIPLRRRWNYLVIYCVNRNIILSETTTMNITNNNNGTQSCGVCKDVADVMCVHMDDDLC